MRVLQGVCLFFFCVSYFFAQVQAMTSCPIPDERAAKSCAGTFRADNQAELNQYLASFGEENDALKHLLINFDVNLERLTIATPCSVTLRKNKTLTLSGGDLCVSTKDDVKFNQVGLNINGDFSITTEADVIFTRGARIVANTMIVQSTGEIRLAREANIVASSLELISTGTDETSQVIIGQRGNYQISGELKLEAYGKVNVGREAQISAASLNLNSRGNTSESTAIIQRNALLSAGDITLSSFEKSIIRRESTINSTGHVLLKATATDTESRARIGNNVTLNALNLSLLGGEKENIGRDSNITLSENLVISTTNANPESRAAIQRGTSISAVGILLESPNLTVLRSGVSINAELLEMNSNSLLDNSKALISKESTINVSHLTMSAGSDLIIQKDALIDLSRGLNDPNQAGSLNLSLNGSDESDRLRISNGVNIVANTVSITSQAQLSINQNVIINANQGSIQAPSVEDCSELGEGINIGNGSGNCVTGSDDPFNDFTFFAGVVRSGNPAQVAVILDNPPMVEGATAVKAIYQFGDGVEISVPLELGNPFDPSGRGLALHRYSNTEVATISLQLEDSLGRKSKVVSKTIPIDAFNSTPVPLVSASSSGGEAPLSVQFDARSSLDADGSITQFIWDFSDGTPRVQGGSEFAQVEHTFSSPGFFPVILTLLDDRGGARFRLLFVNVGAVDPVIIPPLAIADSTPQVGAAPLTVSFDARRSRTPNPPFINFFWNFGDFFATSENPNESFLFQTTHTYTMPGVYNPSLFIADVTGASDEDKPFIFVDVPNPRTLDFVAEKPFSGLMFTFAFDIFLNNDKFDPESAVWDFGDGESAQGLARVQHTYASEGQYVVALEVDIVGEGRVRLEKNFNVVSSETSPVAIINPPFTSGIPGETFLFDGSSSFDRNGGALVYRWSTTDVEFKGTGADFQQFSQTFNEGNFPVLLTVTASNGLSSTATSLAQVDDNFPPTGFALYSQDKELKVLFDGSQFSDPEGAGIAEILWRFGDGQSAHGLMASHTYSNDGQYFAEVAVTDVDGQTAIFPFVVDVFLIPNEPPFVDFFIESSTNRSFTFNAQNSFDPDGVITEFKFDMGDGTILFGDRVTHTYLAAGVYSVMLTVTDDLGAMNVFSFDVEVFNQDPMASFSCQSNFVQTLECDGSGSFDNDGVITSYEWTTSRGTTHQGSSFIAAFDEDGDVFVSLTVTDNDGGTQTRGQTFSLKRSSPPNVVIDCQEVAPSLVSCSGADSNDLDIGDSIVDFTWKLSPAGLTPIEVKGETIEVVVPVAFDQSVLVSLDATDSYGKVGQKTASIFVQRNTPPTAVIDIMKIEAMPGDNITLKSLSSDPENDIVNINWQVSDGREYFNQDEISLSFETEGLFSIVLTVQDAIGNESSASADIMITTNPIVGVAISQARGAIPLRIEVDTRSSVDLNGEIVKTEIIANNQILEEKIAILVFDQVGEHEIKVRVTDNDGNISEKSLVVNAFDGIPIISIPPRRTTADSLYSYSPDVQFSEGFIMSLDTFPEGMALEENTIKWNPTVDQIGEHLVKISLISEDQGLTGEQEFKLKVIPRTIIGSAVVTKESGGIITVSNSTLPEFNGTTVTIPPNTVDEDQELEFNVDLTDNGFSMSIDGSDGKQLDLPVTVHFGDNINNLLAQTGDLVAIGDISNTNFIKLPKASSISPFSQQIFSNKTSVVGQLNSSGNNILSLCEIGENIIFKPSNDTFAKDFNIKYLTLGTKPNVEELQAIAFLEVSLPRLLNVVSSVTNSIDKIVVDLASISFQGSKSFAAVPNTFENLLFFNVLSYNSNPDKGFWLGILYHELFHIVQFNYIKGNLGVNFCNSTSFVAGNSLLWEGSAEYFSQLMMKDNEPDFDRLSFNKFNLRLLHTFDEKPFKFSNANKEFIDKFIFNDNEISGVMPVNSYTHWLFYDYLKNTKGKDVVGLWESLQIAANSRMLESTQLQEFDRLLGGTLQQDLLEYSRNVMAFENREDIFNILSQTEIIQIMSGTDFELDFNKQDVEDLFTPSVLPSLNRHIIENYVVLDASDGSSPPLGRPIYEIAGAVINPLSIATGGFGLFSVGDLISTITVVNGITTASNLELGRELEVFLNIQANERVEIIVDKCVAEFERPGSNITPVVSDYYDIMTCDRIHTLKASYSEPNTLKTIKISDEVLQDARTSQRSKFIFYKFFVQNPEKVNILDLNGNVVNNVSVSQFSISTKVKEFNNVVCSTFQKSNDDSTDIIDEWSIEMENEVGEVRIFSTTLESKTNVSECKCAKFALGGGYGVRLARRTRQVGSGVPDVNIFIQGGRTILNTSPISDRPVNNIWRTPGEGTLCDSLGAL